jgi:D-sedoheptulose 7-phosphate isomerase
MSDGDFLETYNDELTDALEAFSSLSSLSTVAFDVADELVGLLRRGGKILTCGNGGSALEAQHFASELTGHFKRDRPPLPAIALSVDTAVVTAIGNDYNFQTVFSRQVEALAHPGDCLLAFTTSGTSANVLAAIEAARAKGASSIVFTGGDGGRAATMADRSLIVRATQTARIQEGHLFLVHVICEHIDAAFATN